MSFCCSQTFKMSSMIVLVLAYFLVELVMGYVLNSIALVADAFHMLSDFISLIIGVTAHRIGKWPRSEQNTFGWQRAEVVGTQINTITLATLTFTIFIDCIKRFVEPVAIRNPKLLLYVGSVGLLVNVVGLIMLRNTHGHSHGHSHDHSHGHSHGHSHDHSQEHKTEGQKNKNISDTLSNITMNGHSNGNTESRNYSSSKMNTRAVFLHVLSDFLGSVAVVISALILWLVPNSPKNPNGDPWKNYVDPSISLVMIILILIPMIPLIKKSTLILLQSVPKDLKIQELKDQLDTVEGIEEVHDLHIWQLQSDVIIGTVHIASSNVDDAEIIRKVKKKFHDFDIHCTTIQIELLDPVKLKSHNKTYSCMIDCEDNINEPETKRCNARSMCCPQKKIKEVEIVVKSKENEYKEELNHCYSSTTNL